MHAIYDCSRRYQATCPLECFVVACARGTRTAQRGSPAPMAEGRAEAEEWLGAEVGGVKLAEKTQGVLMSGFDEEVWDAEDVPQDGGEGYDKESRETWSAILKDSEEAADVKLGNTGALKFHRHMAARYPVKEQKDEDGKDVPAKYMASAEEREDMRLQGMSDPADLRHLELVKYLGRPGGESEVSGGEYRAPPQTMTGCAKAVKWKVRTFDVVMEEARKTQSSLPLEQFYANAASLCMARGTPRYTNIATLLLQVWQKTSRNIKTEDARLTYFSEFMSQMSGRGFPTLFDLEIGQMVQGMGANNPTSQPAIAGAKGLAADAAEMGQITSAKLDTFMDECRTHNRGMQSKVDSLTSRMSQIESTVRDRFSGKRKCFRCGSEDHAIADCDKPSGWKPQDP